MGADVRRSGGGVLPVHFLQCGTHHGGVGGHAVHIGLLAAGHHGHPQAGGHGRHLVLQRCLYFIRGMLCPVTYLRYFLQQCLYFVRGMLCPLTCYIAN